ncbi:MAG: 4-vinyl reductase, 4VR [Candidatus Magnetoglobus multicellularis str. Araruama]|uniref:4-vinyl reductase, 4VR n=1 Tax=Candidatus Magnetoglobus multicellularis str. Araruama TaxID=890399 RepID=A0A1V1P000_9BACT|nr:MAG: 4-vinyl reductase, 4VR [Candidatus Magnetoglobus multicellularis str. Araruama]
MSLLLKKPGTNNMFKEPRSELLFSWSDLGDIETGRPNLGTTTHVAVYRLMQYTMRDVLIKRYDPQTASQILYDSGKSAGMSFCANVLDKSLALNEFVANLQDALKKYGIGILRIEKVNQETNSFVLSVAEDLDCSGIPMINETICDYDEGFIAGILEEYTGKPFDVNEVDCWATGDRVCRFEANPLSEDDT